MFVRKDEKRPGLAHFLQNVQDIPRTSLLKVNHDQLSLKQNEEAHETNLRLLKDNIDTFFKKESNFKRPPKPEAVYAKLTKNFLPNYEWSSQRRKIPWKFLKKDQVQCDQKKICQLSIKVA